MRPVPVEQSLIAHLATATGKPWSTRVPRERPALFGRLSRSGGGRANLGQARPTVLIECWANDADAAFDLASDTYDALDSLPYQDDPLPRSVYVAEVELTDPVYFPDAVSGCPRYQFIATLTVNMED